MTTEPTESVPPAPCSQCDAPVKIRRPSLTGRHYCQKPECQRAKQRFFYRQRVEGTKSTMAEIERRLAEERDHLIITILRLVTTGERVLCADCGRPDVLANFGHPNQDWTAPCPGGGGAQYPKGLGDQIARTLWPPA